jgi:hypothetical protein
MISSTRHFDHQRKVYELIKRQRGVLRRIMTLCVMLKLGKKHGFSRRQYCHAYVCNYRRDLDWSLDLLTTYTLTRNYKELYRYL